MADEQHGPRILLRASEALLLETKQLPRNRHFDEALRVECPSWLPPWPARVALLSEYLTAAARLDSDEMIIQPYAADGRLLTPLHYPLIKNGVPIMGAERDWPCELIYRDGAYYTYTNNWLLYLDGDQRSSMHHIGWHVYQLVVSPYAPEPQLAAGTPEGVAVYQATRPYDLPPVLHPLEGFAPATDFRFVSAEHLVAIGERGEEAQLYQLTPEGLQLLRTLDHSAPLVAVLPTTDRRHFALLEQDGRVTLHRLAPD